METRPSQENNQESKTKKFGIKKNDAGVTDQPPPSEGPNSENKVKKRKKNNQSESGNNETDSLTSELIRKATGMVSTAGGSRIGAPSQNVLNEELDSSTTNIATKSKRRRFTRRGNSKCSLGIGIPILNHYFTLSHHL